MLNHQFDRLTRLPRSEKNQVKRILGVRSILDLRPKHQSDVVISLLRAGAVLPAVLVAGRPITLFPPSRFFSPSRLPMPTLERHRDPDERVVTRIKHNPRLPTTDAFQRFRLFRVGQTLRQFLARGGRRRDIRLALAQNWISVREVER